MNINAGGISCSRRNILLGDKYRHDVSADLFVDQSSDIAADGMGYLPGRTQDNRPISGFFAGSHGGVGSHSTAVSIVMPTYGSFARPEYPGSGAARSDGNGGPGGEYSARR